MHPVSEIVQHNIFPMRRLRFAQPEMLYQTDHVNFTNVLIETSQAADGTQSYSGP